VKAEKMEADLVINDHLTIPAGELHFTYARSSGPGGQHVNKTSTKVILRWNVAASKALSGDVRGRFLARFATRINARGELLVACDQFREQPANRRACLARLREMVQSVYRRPKKRIRTRPPRWSVEKRLREKRARSQKKDQRSGDW
jgi:ribosome-associated protein